MLNYREKMEVHNGTEGGRIDYNWRLDAIKWCHKVYALTETASDIHMLQNKDWLIWLDADTITHPLQSLFTLYNSQVQLPCRGYTYLS